MTETKSKGAGKDKKKATTSSNDINSWPLPIYEFEYSIWFIIFWVGIYEVDLCVVFFFGIKHAL